MKDMFLLLIEAVRIFGRILEILIIVRCLLSWINPPRTNPVVQLIYALTEPILSPLRKLLAKSPLGGGAMPIDFSPLLAFLLIGFAERLLVQLIILIANAVL